MSHEFHPVGFSDCCCHDALQLGKQKDCGDLWVAVARSQWGTIPGKALGDTCWYSYDGEEHLTNDFVWVTCNRPVKLVKNKGHPPELAIVCGYQSDCGYLYAAIADDEEHGKIPGKARGDKCWYPYGGKEKLTEDFYWIVLDE